MEREDSQDKAYIDVTTCISDEGGRELRLEGVSLLHTGVQLHHPHDNQQVTPTRRLFHLEEEDAGEVNGGAGCLDIR